jgi:hypothetical protein
MSWRQECSFLLLGLVSMSLRGGVLCYGWVVRSGRRLCSLSCMTVRRAPASSWSATVAETDVAALNRSLKLLLVASGRKLLSVTAVGGRFRGRPLLYQGRRKPRDHRRLRLTSHLVSQPAEYLNALASRSLACVCITRLVTARPPGSVFGFGRHGEFGVKVSVDAVGRDAEL